VLCRRIAHKGIERSEEEMKMEIKGFGVNTIQTDGRFSSLQEQLDYLQEAGFDYLEFSLDVVETFGAGKLLPRKVDKVVQMLQAYDFRICAHAPVNLELGNWEERDFQSDLLQSSLELTAAIKAEFLVIHFSSNGSGTGLFEEGISRAAEQARRHGMGIGVENLPSERLDTVADVVRRLRRRSDNVHLVLDTGHEFLSSVSFGYDFIKSVEEAADCIGHFHLNDNFGLLEKKATNLEELSRSVGLLGGNFRNAVRMNLGAGDIHLPVGWGKVPFRQIIPFFKQFKGIIVLEYLHDKYREFTKEILSQTKDLFRGVLE
jgi:sugar phosphate isomerase/epimerase